MIRVVMDIPVPYAKKLWIRKNVGDHTNLNWREIDVGINEYFIEMPEDVAILYYLTWS